MSKGGCAAFRISRRAPIAVLLALAVVAAGAAGATAALAEVKRVQQGYAEDRHQVENLVAQLQATLKGIDRKLAGYLEAQQARTEAARRVAYAGYISGVGSVQSWLQAGAVARAAVRWALAQLGDPYRWGATGPDSFDCSGLTSSAYRAAGVAIPRVRSEER